MNIVLQLGQIVRSKSSEIFILYTIGLDLQIMLFGFVRVRGYFEQKTNRKIAIFTNIEKTEQVAVRNWSLLWEGIVTSGTE